MKIRKNLVLRHIGKEYMIIDPETGTVDIADVYTLNTTAAWLWEQLEGEEAFTLDEVVRLLVRNFDVSWERALEDAIAWANDLKEQGLIVDEDECE